jgi:hypothetical protein
MWAACVVGLQKPGRQLSYLVIPNIHARELSQSQKYVVVRSCLCRVQVVSRWLSLL